MTDKNRVDPSINKVENDRKIDDVEIAEVIDYANKFVDDTIIRAIEKIKNDYSIENNCPGCGIRKPQVGSDDEWPTSEQMTVRMGLKCVKKMMKNWKSEPAMRGWKFYAEFIGLDSDGSSDFYSYQVRWSYPTPAYPEPQVTVSVFFTVEATKLKYPNCPVDNWVTILHYVLSLERLLLVYALPTLLRVEYCRP